jgi:hypothetical protein
VRARILFAAFAIAALLVPAAQGELTRKGDVQVSFDAKIAPKALPRTRVAPVSVSFAGRIATADGAPPPQLRKVTIAINRQGRLDTEGLPTCRLDEIQPATTAGAIAACGDAKVGEGSFSADVVIPEQSPFPSDGEVVAFNGVQGGKPVIFAHVYGTEPIPTSFTLPLKVSHAKGKFGTVLTASLPDVTSSVAVITGLGLHLHRTYRYRGVSHSYLSAACPAPKGFPGALYPLARAGFDFAPAPTLTTTLTRNCRVRR